MGREFRPNALFCLRRTQTIAQSKFGEPSSPPWQPQENFIASRLEAIVVVVTAGLCLFIMIQGKQELFQHL